MSTAYRVLWGVGSLTAVLFANQIFHHKSRSPFVLISGLSAHMKESFGFFFKRQTWTDARPSGPHPPVMGKENISRMRGVEDSVYALLGEVQFPMKKPLWDSISSFLCRNKHIIHSLSKTFSDGKKDVTTFHRGNIKWEEKYKQTICRLVRHFQLDRKYWVNRHTNNNHPLSRPLQCVLRY